MSTEDRDRIALPKLLDDIATRYPDRPFVSLPRDNENIACGYHDFSYGDMANAVNRAAWWIVRALGKCSAKGSFETLHYIGPQDLRYVILILAAVKTGYKVSLLSSFALYHEYCGYGSICDRADQLIWCMDKTLTCHPDASPAEHISLLKATACTLLLHSIPPLPKVQSVLMEKEVDIKTVEVPHLEHWLKEDDGEENLEAFPYTKNLDDALHDPIGVIHTSGTTGTPKVFVMTQGTVAQQINMYRQIPSHENVVYEQWRGLRVALLSPLSIAAGLYCILGLNILFELTMVLPPPVPVTAKTLDMIIVHGNSQVLMVTPRVLPQMIQNVECLENRLENLRRLRYISYVGGPCPQHIGSILASYTTLVSFYGSSEVNILPTVIADPEDWQYIKFHPILAHEFRHTVLDLYELVLLPDDKLGASSSVFITSPPLTEYPMKDLFSKHPTRPDLWLYRGRIDDLICSIDAERFLPNPMEGIIAAHPGISGALVCEQRGGGIALLIEVGHRLLSSDDREKLLDDIWPLVRNANEICPIRAEIKRELVLFADPNNPLPKTLKGYVHRSKSLDLYRSEIDACFRKENRSTPFNSDACSY